MAGQRPGGVGIYTCDGVTTEVATSTCCHCQRITEIATRRRMLDVVDICRLCMGLVCLECAGKPCTPWQKRIDIQESAHYRRSQLAKAAGLE